jgi:hypothetical protein
MGDSDCQYLLKISLNSSNWLIFYTDQLVDEHVEIKDRKTESRIIRN